MRHLLWAATPTPSPTGDVDPNLVTPGVVGFVVTLGLIVATILLLVSLTRRIRRVNNRADIAARLDAEEAEAAERADDEDTRP